MAAKIIGLPPARRFVFEGLPPEQRDEVVTLYMQETAKRGLIGGPGHFFCLTHDQRDLDGALEAIGHAFTAIRRALDEGDVRKYLECPVRQSGFRQTGVDAWRSPGNCAITIWNSLLANWIASCRRASSTRTRICIGLSTGDIRTWLSAGPAVADLTPRSAISMSG